jgi:hypothetical protein
MYGTTGSSYAVFRVSRASWLLRCEEWMSFFSDSGLACSWNIDTHSIVATANNYAVDIANGDRQTNSMAQR